MFWGVLTYILFFSHIWFFADVPHALKNIRNHVLDDGLYLPQQSGTRPVLDKALLAELVKVAAEPEFKMCFKLTEQHINVRMLTVIIVTYVIIISETD